MRNTESICTTVINVKYSQTTNPLKFLLDKSKIDATVQRWCAELANFNITVSYKSGITNIAADALSRVHEDHNQLDDADGIHMWCREIS